MFLKKLFKKDKPIVRKDYSNYKILLNIKSICLFEKMTKKSFLFCNTEYDILVLMYCSLVCNNDIVMTFNLFLKLLEDKGFSSWIMNEYDNISRFNMQFFNSGTTEAAENEDAVKIGELAATLIINFNMDPNYVMEKMTIDELQLFALAAEEKKKEDLVEKRLFSFLQIAPLIDSKKVKKPEDLLPYPWEKEEKKKRAEDNLKNNLYAVQHTIGMQLNIPSKNGE